MRAWIILITAFVFVAACGGGGSDGTPAVPSRFLYASAYGGPNTLPASIYGLAVYTGGTLSPVPGSPASTADGGGSLAITRDSKFLYTTDNLDLGGFQIQADGSLTNVPSSPFTLPAGQQPGGLVAHPSADFLYASGASQQGVVVVFAIDSATGALCLKSSVTTPFVVAPVITPNGRYLYLASYPDSALSAAWQIAGFSTDVATGTLSLVPGGPASPPNSSASPTQMAIDPTGKFLYAGYRFVAANIGYVGGMVAYSIDAASGALTPVPGSPFSVGGAPNSVAVDASGKFLIVSLLPENGPGNCLAVLSIDPGTGTLTPVPGSPFGPLQLCGFVAADPSGPYVYAGNSGQTTQAAVFVLSIDQATGALTSIGQTTIPDNSKFGVSYIALTH